MIDDPDVPLLYWHSIIIVFTTFLSCWLIVNQPNGLTRGTDESYKHKCEVLLLKPGVVIKFVILPPFPGVNVAFKYFSLFLGHNARLDWLRYAPQKYRAERRVE